MRFLLFKGTRVTKKRLLSDIGERKMKTFVQAVALLVIAVLSVALYADELPSDNPSSASDELPPVPMFDTTASDWNSCLESFDFRDYPNALKLINSLIEKHPDNLTFLIRRARCLSAMGKADEALSIYDNLAQKFKDKDEQSAILSEKAVVLVQMHKNEEALKLIRYVDGSNPLNSQRYITCKSMVLIANKAYKDAIPLLLCSLEQGERGQREDYCNNAFILVDNYCITGHNDIALNILDQLLEHYPMYGRFWLARAALCTLFNRDNVLYTLEKAEKCKDAPAIQGDILFLKAYYYAFIDIKLPRAIEYAQQLMNEKSQIHEFGKTLFLSELYLLAKQYDQAVLLINKLDKLAKSDLEQHRTFWNKARLYFYIEDFKAFNDLYKSFERNDSLRLYDKNNEDGQLDFSLKVCLLAWQQKKDNELAQLMYISCKNSKFSDFPFSLTILFYTADWDRRLF